MTKLGYPYSYGDDLTEEQVSASLKEIKRGFLVASSVYSVWALASLAKPAHASDACPNPRTPPDSPAQIAPTPSTKPISDSQKGIITAAVSSICGLAAQTGDFWIGVGCFGLVLIAMRIANR